MAENSKGSTIFWPKITDISSAESASDLGYWAAVVVAAMTTIFATIALVTRTEIATVDAWAYVDAALFGLIAWRIKRRSRAFAVIGLCLFILEKVFQFAQPNMPSSGAIMAVLFLLLFVGGVRGTFAFHRLSRAAALPQEPLDHAEP